MNQCFNYNVLIDISDNTQFLDCPKDGIYATKEFDSLGRNEYIAINDRLTGLHIFKVTETIVNKSDKTRKFKTIYCPELFMSNSTCTGYTAIKTIEFNGTKIIIDCFEEASLESFKKIVQDPRQRYVYSTEFWLKKVKVNDSSHIALYDEEDNLITMSKKVQCRT